jgi:hypothetical protein
MSECLFLNNRTRKKVFPELEGPHIYKSIKYSNYIVEINHYVTTYHHGKRMK